MVLWAYLGLTPGDMPERVPYLRVLAANGTGCRLLSRMREAAAVPVLTRPAQVRRLGPEARRLFELGGPRHGTCIPWRIPASPPPAARSGGKVP